MKFAMLLTVLFIGLKLTHYIDWSWFWVLSPMPIAFITGVFLIGLGVVLMSLSQKKKKTSNQDENNNSTYLN